MAKGAGDRRIPSRMELGVAEFRAVLEVFRTGSFTSAARNLGTSTVTVLNRVSKVEKYFRVRIFERTPKGAVLTGAGRAVVEAAKRIVETVDSLKLPAVQPAKVEETIRICSSRLPSEYVLPCLISNFKLRNESVNFDLRVSDSKSAVKDLQLGKVDVAAVQLEEVARSRKFDRVKIAEDQLVVVTPVHHELASASSIPVRSLPSQPLILISERDLSAAVNRLLDAHGIDPSDLSVELLLGDVHAVIASVSQGLGLGVVPEVVARAAEKAELVKVVPLGASPRAKSIPMYLVKRGGESPTSSSASGRSRAR